jgi:hypothetical protein
VDIADRVAAALEEGGDDNLPVDVPAHAFFKGAELRGKVAPERGVAPADDVELHAGGLARGAEVGRDPSDQGRGLRLGQAARVGENVEAGLGSESAAESAPDRPVGEDVDAMDGLRARGIIVEDDGLGAASPRQPADLLKSFPPAGWGSESMRDLSMGGLKGAWTGGADNSIPFEPGAGTLGFAAPPWRSTVASSLRCRARSSRAPSSGAWAQSRSSGESPTPPAGPGVPWHQTIHRIGQLNFNERDPQELDVEEWADYWASLKVDAVLVSVTGILAFYPTEVPFHRRSQFLGDRDLFGTCTAAAKKRGIRVIARMSPDLNWEDAVKAHPEWFMRDESGGLPGARRGSPALPHLHLLHVLHRAHAGDHARGPGPL